MIENGPLFWMNWQAERESALMDEGYEFILYSDSHFTGLGAQEAVGPYRLINALSGISGDNRLRPGIVLEIDLHRGEFPEMEPPPIRPATGSARWISLSVDEELAVILSLILGARLRSSGIFRKWDSEFPHGRPWLFDYREPVLPDAKTGQRQMMFPDLPGKTVNLDLVGTHLASIPALSADTAVALTRAAREYSNALWIAESDPELAWLQLVSAIEVAANSWNGTMLEPVADLEEAFPELTRKLRDADEALLTEAAGALQGLTRSTKKFTSFCEEYLPGAPLRERDWFDGLDWSDKRDMRRRVRTVYKHRSKRLHEAIPFPSPLTSPGPLGTPTDTPVGEGSASGFSSWEKKDLPFTLWAFAHLTRGCLLNWWRSMSASLAG